MSTATLTDADLRVREHVVRHLDWDPAVDASGIGVAARDGVVTLTGVIDTYAGKLAAERVAKRVRGVRAVANDLDVRLKLDRTDADIAHDVALALRLRATVPDTVQAAVHDAHVTLTGRVHSLYQAREAEKALRHIRGVRSLFNHLEIVPPATVGDVTRRIAEALRREADVDARHVHTAVTDDVVVLNGTVTTWGQRDAVERAAASAPGVVRVINDVVVQPPHDADDIC